jgi:superfamily II DNA or RNA helicase
MPIYHKCLGKFGYIVRKDSISKDQEKTLMNDLTVKTTVLPAYRDFQKPKIYKIYFHNTLAYFMPRFYGMETFGSPDYAALSKGEPIHKRCQFEPLKHQLTALAKAREIFDPSKELGGGGVLSLPCGYGKTYCATKIASDYLKVAALVVVPTECLMDQWMDAIKTFVPGARIGYIQRDHVDVEDKDFVVAMLHSLALKDYDIKTFDRFGITIFDECHHMASESFCKAMMKTRTRFMLGLSATPNRTDGLSHVFYKFLGPLFHKEKRTGCNVVYIKKIKINSNSENFQTKRMGNGTINTAGMTTAVAKLPERNILIIHIIHELIKQGRKILVLSSRKDHLHTIKDMLDAEGIKHPVTGKYITYGFYYGKKGMTRVAHKELLSQSAKCDIVLGISQIAREGLDIPDLNALIFVTPAGMEVEQPVGRILRKFHKTLNPLVIDLVDNTGNYVKHSRERDKWYTEEGYMIQEDMLQLLDNPDRWKDDITSFIQQQQPTPKPTVDEPSKEPELNDCLLLMPGDCIKIKKKTRPKAKIQAKKKNPLTDSCLLSDSSAILPARPTREKHVEPDLNTLML